MHTSIRVHLVSSYICTSWYSKVYSLFQLDPGRKLTELSAMLGPYFGLGFRGSGVL